MEKQLNGNPITEKEVPSERLFRNVTVVLVLILLYCIPGFLSFKELASAKGYHFVKAESWWWCLVGFIVYGSVKYSYFSLSTNAVLSILNPKFEGDERLYRMRAVRKLIFDVIFYSAASATAFLLFKDESWFPAMIGGEGNCSQIYEGYPHWPPEPISVKLEIYYMCQLGIHFFSIFEIVTIRRKTDRKYYQFLLHHFMATTLILFSMLTNQITVGTVILFVHNFSDIAGAFVRAMVDTKFNNIYLIALYWFGAVISWSYMRTIVLPFCAIRSVYENIPTAGDPWSSVRIPHIFLLSLLSILVCMHIFWLYFLVKTGIDMALGKAKSNAHEDFTIKQKQT